MELTIKIKPLVDALRIAVKLATQFYKGSPFYSVGALVANEDKVYVMTSNGKQYIALPVPDADVKTNGRGVVSLTELIRVLDGSTDKQAETTLSVVTEPSIGRRLLVKKGKAQHKLQLIQQDEYPTWEMQTEKLEGEPQSAWMTTADFMAAMNYAAIASSSEDARPVLQFVEMCKVEGEERIQFLCADGFRLHRARVATYDFPLDEQFYGLLHIPSLKVFMSAEKLLGNKIGVHLFKNAIRVISSTGVIFHHEGEPNEYKFPDVKSLFPKVDFTLTLPVADVTEALRESKHYSHKNNETLSLVVRHTSRVPCADNGHVPTQVRFTATAEGNSFEMEADGEASQIDTPFGVGINHVFLREAIHPDTKTITLQTRVEGDGTLTCPMLFPYDAEGENGVQYAALVMPMSMRDIDLTPLAMAKLREQHPDIYPVYTVEPPPSPEPTPEPEAALELFSHAEESTSDAA